MAANTNAVLILGIFGFYTFIFVMLGLIGYGLQSTEIGTPPTPDGIGFITQISYFFSGIFFTITNIPVWANTILFLPLGITVMYIILSFLRGSS